jgi:hypothetical protein
MACCTLPYKSLTIRYAWLYAVSGCAPFIGLGTLFVIQERLTGVYKVNKDIRA